MESLVLQSNISYGVCDGSGLSVLYDFILNVFMGFALALKLLIFDKVHSILWCVLALHVGPMFC